MEYGYDAMHSIFQAMTIFMPFQIISNIFGQFSLFHSIVQLYLDLNANIFGHPNIFEIFSIPNIFGIFTPNIFENI